MTMIVAIDRKIFIWAIFLHRNNDDSGHLQAIFLQYFCYLGGEIFHLVGQLTSPLQARTDCGLPDRRLLAHGLRAENDY